MSARVVVSLRVAASPARAFDVFTRDIGLWWQPNALFQFTPKGAGVLSFETDSPDGPGRLIETGQDGEVFEIGKIVVWEPGVRLSFGWRQASFRDDQMTWVDVRFEAVGEGATRVTVEHRGWDSVPQEHVARHRFPERAFMQRHSEWWQTVLTAFYHETQRAS